MVSFHVFLSLASSQDGSLLYVGGMPYVIFCCWIRNLHYGGRRPHCLPGNLWILSVLIGLVWLMCIWSHLDSWKCVQSLIAVLTIFFWSGLHVSASPVSLLAPLHVCIHSSCHMGSGSSWSHVKVEDLGLIFLPPTSVRAASLLCKLGVALSPVPGYLRRPTSVWISCITLIVFQGFHLQLEVGHMCLAVSFSLLPPLLLFFCHRGFPLFSLPACRELSLWSWWPTGCQTSWFKLGRIEKRNRQHFILKFSK